MRGRTATISPEQWKEAFHAEPTFDSYRWCGDSGAAGRDAHGIRGGTLAAGPCPVRVPDLRLLGLGLGLLQPLDVQRVLQLGLLRCQPLRADLVARHLDVVR